jgi:hypothetical protein
MAHHLAFIAVEELGIVNIALTYNQDARLAVFKTTCPHDVKLYGAIKFASWNQAKTAEEHLLRWLENKGQLYRPGWYRLTLREVLDIFETAYERQQSTNAEKEAKSEEKTNLEKAWFQAGYRAGEAGRPKQNGWRLETDLRKVRSACFLWNLGWKCVDKPDLVGSMYKDWMPES